MSSPAQKTLARIRGIRTGLERRHGAGGAKVLAIVALATLGCAALLIFDENPWDRGVPAKIRGGKALSIHDTIVSGIWLGAALNAALGAVLLIFSKYWAVPDSAPPAAAGPAVLSPAGRRAFWVAVALAMAAAAWVRAPKLSHSLWNDEEQAFRKFTWGEHVEKPDGSVAFHPASWERSLFYSVNGNNHVVHTIGARFGLAVWRIFSGSGPDTFSEAAARMEPLLSGLLTLAALAFWLRSIGYPAAGAGAAWILALHPWHARYSAEARGYSALLLFVVLAVLCLTFALRTRRWRWWLGYGASQCLYLLCFAGAVYVAVGMNLLVAAFLLWKRDGVAIRRWLVACVLGAMVFLQMMTATVLRIWRWVQAPHVEPFPIDRGFGRDFWAHLAIGAPWSNDDPVLHRFTSLSRLAGESAFFDAGLKFVLPALLIAGIGLALARGGRDSRLFFGSLLLAAVLVFIHNRLFNMAYYTWYAIWAVVAFAAALALLPEILSRGKNRLAIGLVAAVVVFYGALSRPALARMRLHDRHPMRQAVVAVRGEAPALEARHAALLTGTAGSGANQVRTYDPRVRWVKTVADLDALVAEARRSGKPLVIYACGLGQMARATPDLLARLRDPALFTADPDPILGLEEFWSFRLFRLNPEKPAP